MMKKLFLWTALIIIGFSGVLSAAQHDEFPVSTPPLTPGIFPCSNCHAGLVTNPKRRAMRDEHTEIKLHHAEGDRWCLDCHDPGNRDKLKLANGDTINFTESYLLCGQCHGNIFRDWGAGIHGKRVGYFKGGKRVYFLCVNCHDPHNPRFKPLKPDPPPIKPERKNGR